jgi:WD40 repeat protein
VTSVVFSPDGSHIASGSGDKTVQIWDARTGVHLTTLKGHSGSVRSIAFSPDGSHIASGSGDNTVQIWDARTGAHLKAVKNHFIDNISAVFAAKSTGITSVGDGPSFDVTSCEIHLTQSPGWLVVKSGHNSNRVWLPAGTFSHSYSHSLYGSSVVVGTDEGLLLTLKMTSSSRK